MTSSIRSTDKLLEPKPDSWKGWLVVLGCFFAQAAVFGNLNTFGVYLDAYRHANPAYSNAQLALIGCLHSFFILSGGLWVPSLAVRYLGIKKTVFLGGILQVLGYNLAAVSTQLLQLYLSQGVLVGIGSALIFFPMLPLPPQWFVKHRALANGVSCLGSGLGTLGLSLLIRYLLTSMGITTTLRIMSAILFMFTIIAVCVAKERVPLTPPAFKSILSKGLLNRKVVCMAFFMLLGNFAYYAVIFFIPSYSRFIGLNSQQGAMFVSILMSFNAVSCVTVGFLADSLGRLRILICCIALASMACGAVWPMVNSFSLMMVFVGMYGLAIGGFLSMPAVVIAEIVEEQYLRGTLGLLFSLNSIGGLIGPSIVAHLLDFTNGTSYLPVQLYTSSCFTAGLIALLVLAYFNKKYKQQSSEVGISHSGLLT